MTNNLKFTIVICTFNHGEYLKKAINSVFAQTMMNWELIVVNDGSVDNTFEILNSLKSFPYVTIIHNSENKGKSVCMNIALDLSKGDWLVELDADDWLSNNCLEKAWEEINKLQDDVVLVYGKYKEWRERTRDGKLFFSKIQGGNFVNYIQYIDNPTPIAPRIYKTIEVKRIKGWNVSDMYEGRMFEDIYVVSSLAIRGKVVFIDDILYNRRLRKFSTSNKQTAEYNIWKKWLLEKINSGSE
ncbi:Hyaluronan synthase [Bacillus sp. THAF10]|uniref:glycosyltransferase family 2 protein n=1 Tax=Bacillus sp. THAF10 TaxID=2587848 RepID=UPI0012A8F08B|nr:glycosyltransferase family 2 protein [Bacillus sp. THAF10]QFT88409.1 Hyaluronan synthase [Bacillus sp. THAF10]